MSFPWTKYRAWLFDGDGVLYEAGHALPGAVELLEKLSNNNVPTVLVTNNSTRTLSQYQQKLKRLNLHLTSIVTSAYTAVENIAAKSAFVIGEDGIFDACLQAGISTDPSTYDIPDAVIVGMDTKLTYDKLASAVHYILQGASFVATNPDKTFPVGDRLAPGAGSMIAAVAACVNKEPMFIAGKPNSIIFEQVLNQLGLTADQVVMVGDRYETDILGASLLGIDTILVRTGIASHYSTEDIQELLRGQHPPSFVYSSLNEIVDEVR